MTKTGRAEGRKWYARPVMESHEIGYVRENVVGREEMGGLERYQDVLTNGLDLLSFIFITPELARLSRIASWILKIISFLCIGLVLCSLPYVVLILVAESLSPTDNNWIVLGLAVVVVGLQLFMQRVYSLALNWLDGLFTRASKYLFAAGVGIFFISRILGLAFATLRLRSGG
jgi:hypothetical protein